MSQKQGNKQKHMSASEWHRELVNRTVERIERRNKTNPKFIRHLCLAFCDVTDGEIKELQFSDIDPNTQQYTCALTDKAFDDKITAYSSPSSTALLSPIAYEALQLWYQKKYNEDPELREIMLKRKPIKPVVKQKRSTIGDLLSSEQIDKLRKQNKKS